MEPSVRKFIEAARSLLGARWRHRGRQAWAVDCVGLLVLSARAAGWYIEDHRYYGREPWDDLLRSELRRQIGAPVPEGDEWRPGDVALMRWRPGEPTHIAIITDYIYGGLALIHCENINGCVEHSLDNHYQDCVIEVYRPCDKFCQ